MTAVEALRWRRHGRIFDPREHVLASGCTEFAQSPQALVFDDFVRVYFSSRERDPTGKYLSHVCYADFSRDFSRLIAVNQNPVIALGKPGCFDQHGIFPMHVARIGGRICGYTSGWTRRVSVSVDTGIGLAISDDDGRTFNRIGDGPVLAASLHEPFLVGDPFVLTGRDGVLHMWYIFGVRWVRYSTGAPPDRVYKIGHATSNDGVHWRKVDGRAVIPDLLHADESQALPTVIRIGERWRMLFCYRESADFRTADGRGYRIGHAWSDDLATWTRDDRAGGLDLAPSGWDSQMMCYPHLFECGGRTCLLYNGNEFGRCGFGLAILE